MCAGLACEDFGDTHWTWVVSAFFPREEVVSDVLHTGLEGPETMTVSARMELLG